MSAERTGEYVAVAEEIGAGFCSTVNGVAHFSELPGKSGFEVKPVDGGFYVRTYRMQHWIGEHRITAIVAAELKPIVDKLANAPLHADGRACTKACAYIEKW